MQNKDAKLIYDEGILIPGTSLWMDPEAPRDMSFLSHAGTLVPRYYRKAISTHETAVLARAPSREQRKFHPLVLPYGQNVSIGNSRVELLPSGFVPGGAQIWMETSYGTTLYSRDISLKGAHNLEGASVRKADTLILGTDGAIDESAIPSMNELERALRILVWEALQKSHGVLIGCEELGSAQDVSRALHDGAVLHHAHPRIALINRALTKLGFPTESPSASQLPQAGEVVIWPLDRLPTPESLPPKTQVLLVKRNTRGCVDTATHRHIRWSALPSKEELVQFVSQISPKEVITVGMEKEALARRLREEGWKASPLVKTPQLPLQI